MTSMIRQHCDRKLISLYRARIIAAGSAVTVLSGAASALYGRASALFFFPLASAALTAAASLLLPVRFFSGLGYIRHSDWLLVERGLLSRKGTLIPRSRISFIALRSGPIERRLGICTLVLSAGGKTVRLPGLNLSEGARMKQLLERRTQHTR